MASATPVRGIRFSEELWTKITALATKAKKTASQYVRDAVEKAVKRDER